MDEELEKIFVRIQERLSRSERPVRPPFIYLDPDGVRYLFRELTGLDAYPRRRFAASPVEGRAAVHPILDPELGSETPEHIVFSAMWPLLKDKIPEALGREDVGRPAHRYIRIRGLFQSTRFPDGELNFEIQFAGVRGLLFFDDRYFGPVMRPLMGADRFYQPSAEVEALVYLHAPAEQTIFYHQHYGDDREHVWAPLVPTAVWAVETADS